MVASESPLRTAAGDRLARFVDDNGPALLLTAAVLAAAVGAMWIVAKTTSAFPPVDHASALRAWQAHHGPLRDAARAVSAIGHPLVAIVAVAALALACRDRFGPRVALLPLAAAAVVVPTTIAKHLPGRVTSLPSGHVAFAVAVGGYAAWLLLRAGHPRRAAVLAGLCLLMAPARVIEGAHRPPDVIAGAAAGIAWLLVVLVVGRRWAARYP